MKKLIILFALLFLSSAEIIKAGDETTTVLNKENSNYDQNRKRIPAKPIIVNYGNHEFRVVDFANHSLLNFEIVEDEIVDYSFSVTSLSPSFPIEFTPGSYDITCTAEDGTVYVGTIII